MLGKAAPDNSESMFLQVDSFYEYNLARTSRTPKKGGRFSPIFDVKIIELIRGLKMVSMLTISKNWKNWKNFTMPKWQVLANGLFGP